MIGIREVNWALRWNRAQPKIKIKCEPNFFIRQDCFDLQSKPNPHENKIFNHDPLDGLTLTYKGLDLYDDESIVLTTKSA